jgi:thioesterase domain-containing protein
MVGLEPAAECSFADAGGDSLRLLNLMFRLELALDRPLPMDLLHGGMDLAAMAEALRCSPGQAPPEAAVVFLLPGIGGDEPRLAALRARVRPAIRMEAVAYPDWTWLLRTPRPGLAAIVSHVVDQVERAAPAGAVQLAGYSYGCRLAHAVASALMQRGRALAGPVLLLDGPAMVRDQSILFGADDAAYSLREKTARWLVRRLVAPGDLGAMQRQALRLVSVLPRAWLAGTFGFYLRKYLGGALLGPATAGYRPVQLDADAVVYRSGANAGTDQCLGWRPYWRHLRVIDVPGDHASMLDEIALQHLDVR